MMDSDLESGRRERNTLVFMHHGLDDSLLWRRKQVTGFHLWENISH